MCFKYLFDLFVSMRNMIKLEPPNAELNHFKRRSNFPNETDHTRYLMNYTKPNMLVVCNRTSFWNGMDYESTRVLNGTRCQH